jgi:glycosyltransferase involved in cell wall biosynthesis
MALKILFLSHAFSPAIGGIESSSELLADVFVKAGHQVRLMTTTLGKTENLPYEVIRNPSALEMIQHHRWADVVYENNPCLRLGWPKLLFGKPSVVVLQTWLSPKQDELGLAGNLKLRWLAHADKVIAISQAVQQRCWPKSCIIGNSYDDNMFRIKPSERRKDFVFLGRLVSDKGAQLAVRAFADMAFHNPVPELGDAKLTIIGDGQDRSELESLVASLPDPSRVHFAGPLRGEALVDELNKYSFQFIPSAWEEPFGIVALEGIACGLIPIGSDGGGLPEAIGEAGVTFKRGQLDSLIAVTSKLLQSPEQQARCRTAAHAHLAKFGTKSITHELMSAVEEVAS